MTDQDRRYKEILNDNKSLMRKMRNIENSPWRRFKAWCGRAWNWLLCRKPKEPDKVEMPKLYAPVDIKAPTKVNAQKQPERHALRIVNKYGSESRWTRFKRWVSRLWRKPPDEKPPRQFPRLHI